MDYEKIERALVERTKTLYQDFVAANPIQHFDSRTATKAERAAHRIASKAQNEALRAAKGRYANLLARVRAHRAFLADRHAKREQRSKYLHLLRAVADTIDSNGVVISFDVERGWPNVDFPNGEFRELGMTILRGSHIESYNLRVDTAQKAHWVGFNFGETKRLSQIEIFNRFVKAASDAKFYVGHSLNVDIEYLNTIMEDVGYPPIPYRRVVDTFFLASLHPDFDEGRERANLSNVATLYGVPAPNPHSGGNDARYNMELLQAMVNAHVRKPPSEMVGAISLDTEPKHPEIGNRMKAIAIFCFGVTMGAWMNIWPDVFYHPKSGFPSGAFFFAYATIPVTMYFFLRWRGRARSDNLVDKNS